MLLRVFGPAAGKLLAIMKRRLMTVLALVSSVFPALMNGQDLQKMLNSQYHDKILYLRHSFKADSQEYDAQGQPVNPSGEGPWSLYGRMDVNKIAIDKDRLRVEGKRAVYRHDGRGCGIGCMPYMDGKQVKVTIRLSGPLSSVSDADTALNRVFAVTPEDMVSSVPAYWQNYLAKFTGQAPKDGAQRPDAGSEKVFRLGEDGVTPPKAVYQREPEFSEFARAQRFQGTLGMNVTVDKTGQVSRVSITNALGMGLDEQAVDMVRTWRFTPASRNGEPVAVGVWIEVSFNLYNRR
jgi:TonB family protein